MQPLHFFEDFQQQHLNGGERHVVADFRLAENFVKQKFDVRVFYLEAAFESVQVGRKIGKIIFVEFDVKSARVTVGFDVVMRFLPAMKKQAAGGALIAFLFIALDQIALQNKRKISIFVIMPVNLTVSINGIGQRYSVEFYNAPCFSEKIARLQILHNFLNVYFIFFTKMISAAIETAISSGVRLLIFNPIGVRILASLFLSKPSFSRFFRSVFIFARLPRTPKYLKSLSNNFLITISSN